MQSPAVQHNELTCVAFKKGYTGYGLVNIGVDGEIHLRHSTVLGRAMSIEGKRVVTKYARVYILG